MALVSCVLLAAITTGCSNATSSNNAAAPDAASASPGTPPVYPGAVPGTRPEGVAEKAPPATVKAYSTVDSFATVKAWYVAHLTGATEVSQPGKEKSADAFLVGDSETGTVVLVQSYKGKTWILIGPPK